MNFFTGTLLESKIDIGHVSIAIPVRKMNDLREQGYVNRKMIMGIRPEDFHDEADFIENSTGSIIDGKIEIIEVLGAETIVYSQIANQPFIARVNPQSDVKLGQVRTFAIDMNKVHLFDYKTENRIQLVEE